MSEKEKSRGEDRICTDIPKGLYDRVAEYCKTQGISPSEFIFDAISDKLLSIHRERRRRPRL
ncbi:MAG: hypothetical protein CSA23_07890 [Deltaproteobacteria bacterium]|nr:MAG: hypothetical protein CSA23_07890 [Deltaproteobacteria bacterium]